ncbi:hypothetical protein J4861_03115 [Prevotella melaninogenica]|uniref:hypothetical protein n=1 Tax=Prevotella melaninogenica TaxID=28132 RepID=UPI001BA7BB07|nr:hypothetical protein [Prevotella melaninogenica]QUB60071.1 hypothetical protein J4861_03115 [Prevotella melaninogenica]
MIVIERKIYQKPQCNIVCTETEALLVHASGNAGTIQSGTTVGDAKHNFFNEGEDQEETSWDSTENY